MLAYVGRQVWWQRSELASETRAWLRAAKR
jgi:hypothetical protein